MIGLILGGLWGSPPHLYPWMMTLVGRDVLRYEGCCVSVRVSCVNICAQSTFLLVSSRYWTCTLTLCCWYSSQVVLFRSAHSSLCLSSTPGPLQGNNVVLTGPVLNSNNLEDCSTISDNAQYLCIWYYHIGVVPKWHYQYSPWIMIGTDIICI